jgi:adenine phosphoribosyltransferase
MAIDELVRSLVRDIPDFPRPGILFKDITPILKSPGAMRGIVEHWAERHTGSDIEVIAGVESRGFLFGAALALHMDRPFVPIRKRGKLPADTVRAEYQLEYGTDAVEIHRDALEPGQRVLLIDDLLATGGTLEASARLIEVVGGRVEAIVCVIELGFLEGRAKLPGRSIDALVTY